VPGGAGGTGRPRHHRPGGAGDGAGRRDRRHPPRGDRVGVPGPQPPRVPARPGGTVPAGADRRRPRGAGTAQGGGPAVDAAAPSGGLTGRGPPMLDASVQSYFEALARAEPVEVDGEPVVLSVQAPFTVTEGDSSYVVAPAKEFRLTVTIEWSHPLIGRQSGSYSVTPQSFAHELAPARTFGFASEVAGLKAKGLIKGASATSAIVLDDRALVNGGKLRWPDEFVRHKAADIVGDLALTGARIRAHVVATRPSHGGNVAPARALSRAAKRTGAPAMGVGRIMDVLPHRYP